MAGKKTGKRLLTWVLVLVMALSLLPLNALAAGGPETDSSSGMNFDKRATRNGDGTYTITMTAQATGKTTTTSEAVPMDIVLVLDQSGSMADDFNGNTTYNNEARRQYAMKEAVNNFIGEVAGKYSNEADHRMAIVTFGNKADTQVNWTAVNPAGETELTRSIGNLPPNPSGATNVGAGMQAAQTLMGSDYNYTDGNTDRLKTVIVFTDGVPTKQSDFNTEVANTAISAAKAMKASDVTIYTVGIFNGANPTEMYGASGFDTNSDGTVNSEWAEDNWGLFPSTDFPKADRPAGNRFLNLVSSNYPNADSIGLKRKTSGLGILYSGISYKITKNFNRVAEGDYYLTASDASSLEKIFKDISTMVPEPDNAELNGDTVITDTLSDYFTFAGTAEDVKVYAIDANGNKKESEDAAKVKPVVTGKTVTVTGYDFSAHHTKSADPEELVIEIKVKPSGKGYSEEKIPTNEGNATVMLDEKEIDKAAPPTVDGYSVEYAIGNGASWPNNGNGPEKLYYPQDADVAVTDSVPTLEGNEFTGWTPFTDNDAVVAPAISEGKFTMPAANVTLTAQWREIEAAEPTPATVTLRETDANGNALINKHLTITAKEAETIQNAYFCVAVTAADDATEAVFTAEPRYATTTTVKDMTRTSDGTAVEGSFVFPEQSVLTFTEEGTYAFTVKEVFDEHIKVNHTTYDDTEYTMTVNVTKDEGENKLNAAVSFTKGEGDPTSNITFNNTYKTPVIPTYTFDLSDLDTITVYKEFKSKYGRSATMSFEATATIEKETYTAEVDPNFPSNRSAVTAEPTYIGKATGTVTLKTDTTDVFKFDKTFKLEPGDYLITVKETEGPDRYVVDYDTTTYTYEFTVDNEGKINIDTPITCTFTNKYTKRHSAATPSKPTLNTGDHYAYVMGYPDGTVRPNGSITRAEVSTILFRLLSDKTRDEYFTTESSFTDVKAGAWYNNSIATLEKAGVIVDTAKGGAFRPNEAITRAELAAMLAQFSDAKPVKGVKFSDVSAEHWAYEAIAIAAKMGWIEGYPDGTFRPDATITRAEMMTLVNRALERVPSDEDHLLSKRVMLTFPDCKSGDWFYIAVQEATNSHTYERAATEKNGDEQWTALRANRDWTQLEK